MKHKLETLINKKEIGSANVGGWNVLTLYFLDPSTFAEGLLNVSILVLRELGIRKPRAV